MKIIKTDNLNRSGEHPRYDESTICEKVPVGYGHTITKFLNDTYSSPYGDNFYKLVDDDYQLIKFEGY